MLLPNRMVRIYACENWEAEINPRNADDEDIAIKLMKEKCAH